MGTLRYLLEQKQKYLKISQGLLCDTQDVNCLHIRLCKSANLLGILGLQFIFCLFEARITP